MHCWILLDFLFELYYDARINENEVNIFSYYSFVHVIHV
jgi:hypothetical protein